MYAARKIDGRWAIVRTDTGKPAGYYPTWHGALTAAIHRNRYGRHR